MGQIDVLVTAELNKTVLDEMSTVFHFTYAGYGKDYTMLTHQELKELVKDKDILISEFDTVDDDIFSNSHLKLVICCRGGVSTVVDLKSAKKHNVIVCNNLGRNKESSANFTIALLLDLIKNISITNHMVHTDKVKDLIRPMPKEYGDSLWGLDEFSPYVKYRSPALTEITVGIIGFGQVGSTVAAKLDAMGIKWIATTRKPVDDPRFVDLDTLLKASDVVTLHVSGNAEKRPILGIDDIRKMKPTAYLINTSRGYLLDEDDLYTALKTGLIRGAAVDVLLHEPISLDNKLLELDNLIITPHIAGSSKDTVNRGTNMVVEALMGYVRGTVPHRVV